MARLAYTSILIALVATCASAQAQQQRGGSAAEMMSSIPGNSETINGLSGSGNVNTSTGTATLAVGNSGASPSLVRYTLLKGSVKAVGTVQKKPVSSSSLACGDEPVSSRLHPLRVS